MRTRGEGRNVTEEGDEEGGGRRHGGGRGENNAEEEGVSKDKGHDHDHHDAVSR